MNIRLEFKRPTCPECGSPAWSILEHILVDQPITPVPGTGLYEYKANGEVIETDSAPYDMGAQQVELACVKQPNDHRWLSGYREVL